MGGIISITGEPGRPPVRVGTSIGDLTASLFTVVGILSALQHRERTGQGQMVDISMLDCQAALLENAIARYAVTGEVPGPLGSRHPAITPFQVFESRNGYFVLAIGNDTIWGKFCEVIQRPDLVTDPRFATNPARTEHQPELERILNDVLRQKTTDEWLGTLEPAGIPCGPIQSVDQVVNHPQIRAREMIVAIEHPDAGPLPMPGSPVKLSASPAKVEKPAPRLGEHTAEVLSGLLGLSNAEIWKLRQEQVI